LNQGPKLNGGKQPDTKTQEYYTVRCENCTLEFYLTYLDKRHLKCLSQNQFI